MRSFQESDILSYLNSRFLSQESTRIVFCEKSDLNGVMLSIGDLYDPYNSCDLIVGVMKEGDGHYVGFAIGKNPYVPSPLEKPTTSKQYMFIYNDSRDLDRGSLEGIKAVREVLSDEVCETICFNKWKPRSLHNKSMVFAVSDAIAFAKYFVAKQFQDVVIITDSQVKEKEVEYVSALEISVAASVAVAGAATYAVPAPAAVVAVPAPAPAAPASASASASASAASASASGSSYAGRCV